MAHNDVGMAEDLVFALSNLIAIENHAYQSYNITKDKKWLETIDIARKMRTKWLETLVKKENSQLWCVSKHLLASACGFMEVGNRFNSTKQSRECEEAYEDSCNLVSLFLILNEMEGKNGTAKSSA